MRETRALKSLKKLYPTAHFQRIETWTATGVPDLNGCLTGVEVWVEMKQVDRPKTMRGKIKPEVKKEQIAWEKIRRAAGGRTFIAMMVDYDFYLLPGWCIGELSQGIEQDRLEELKLNEMELFKC